MTQVVLTRKPRTVYVLGAGFSRAVSSEMPVTDELGSRAADRLGMLGSAFIPKFDADGITFETWMSWLSERQPYQDEEAYFDDQAKFAGFTRTLAHILDEAQGRALQAGLPTWIYEFLSLVHWSCGNVVTLNYDTLIETALDQAQLFDNTGRVGSGSVVTSFPSNASVMFGDGRGHIEQRDTFSLHKLHGSVDWFAVAGDRTGATLDRFTTTQYAHPSVREVAIGGRDVFLVPPTSSKTGYFDNPKTRFIWRRAQETLLTADRVVLMGYSLPLTDSALARMLWMTLSPGKQQMVVVNPYAGEVSTRLTALGVDPARITKVTGLSCVRNFVEAERDTLAREVASDFAGQHHDAPVAVGWSVHSMSAVTEASFDEAAETLLLDIDAPGQPLASISRQPGRSKDNTSRHTHTVGELLSLGTPAKIVARHGDHRWTIAARHAERGDAPAWILLEPAGSYDVNRR